MPKSADRAPRVRPVINKPQKQGLVIVYTGDGKGKTTAALGAALRALGQGLKVAMVQFMKGKWETGEMTSARKFGNRFKLFSFGEGFTWETKNFQSDLRYARRGWRQCRRLLCDRKYDLVILDEIHYCLQYGFLDVSEVLKAFKAKPFLKHVILTGRKAPRELIRFADLVTEMKCVKHPFKLGIGAQKGIEY